MPAAEGSGMSHILPYDAAYCFFQVMIGGDLRETYASACVSFQ